MEAAIRGALERAGSPDTTMRARIYQSARQALARSLERQGLTDPVLDKLLVSILPADLARAEERARYWPSQPPTAVAENSAAPELSPAAPATP